MDDVTAATRQRALSTYLKNTIRNLGYGLRAEEMGN